MAHSEDLAEHVRSRLAIRSDIGEAEVVEKKMFGGLSFLINGNMSAGVIKQEFVFRIDPEKTDDALSRTHARPMDFTGKPMRGFVFVAADVLEDDAAFDEWIEMSVGFALSLKPKAAKPRANAKHGSSR